MSQTIRDRRAAMAWQRRYNPQAPKVGAIAPDFSLRDVDGLNPVRLVDFRGRRPVALVFGSFT